MESNSMAERLFIQPGASVWSSRTAQLDLLNPLSHGVRVVDRMREATITLVFAEDAATLREELRAYNKDLSEPRTVWICYPRVRRDDLNWDPIWLTMVGTFVPPAGQVHLDPAWSATPCRFDGCGPSCQIGS